MYRMSLAALALLLPCPFSPGRAGAGGKGWRGVEKVCAELREQMQGTPIPQSARGAAEGRATHFTIRRGERPEETAKRIR